MRKVKCQKCSAILDMATAHRVPKKNIPNRFVYYCSKDEYETQMRYLEMLHKVRDYFAFEIWGYKVSGDSFPNVIINRIKKIRENYDFDIILLTLKENRDYLSYICEFKEFPKEVDKVNYVMAIIETEINGVYQRWKKRKETESKIISKDDENLPIFIDDKNTKVNGNDRGIAKYLDEGDF